MNIINSVLTSMARAGIQWLSRRNLPQTSGKLQLPGLEGPVEVLRDRWGIPHIYAGSRHDLFFAQGFVHAQDRLWQMELNRRTAQGRLSEVLGPLAFETDRTARTFGFHRLGRAGWAAENPRVRQGIEAYTQGVNAFLEHTPGQLPVEFTLLNYRPEPWQPEDTAAFIRLVLWQLSHAWYGEIVRAQVAQAVGCSRAAELEVEYPQENPVTLPEGIEFNSLAPTAGLGQVPGPFLDHGKGSNAWVVSSRRSLNGSTYLCNDMHLTLRLPALWYENHLVADDLQVTGVSMPGIPLVLVGHNGRVAWGMTLAYTDCEDVYVEQFDQEHPTRYRFRDEWLEAEVHAEKIQVKGEAEPRQVEVTVTRHGPVISDVVGYPEQRVALQSMALRSSTAIQGWLALNSAGNWDEFVDAMRLITAPQLNVTYADVNGNIGYWVTGQVPVRSRGNGSVPVPGWDGEWEWVGEVSFEEMPHALNPATGYLVSCNHCIIPSDYPHYLGNAWMNGYRARRVTDLFEQKERLGVEDFRRIQLDLTCLPGQELARRLEGFSSRSPEARLALDLLAGWDGRMTTDSVAGTVYETVRFMLIRNVLEPGLEASLAKRMMGIGFHPVFYPVHELHGQDTVALLRLLDSPDSWWVEQAGGRQAWIERSLKDAVVRLREELGPDPHTWQWGRVHQVSFEHTLGAQKPLDQVFNRGPFPVGGDTDTPCQLANLPNQPYGAVAWGPSYRQIIDLGDVTRSLAMYPAGQSGHLASRHYDDLIRPWLEGEYHPMLWTREQVERELEAKLVLEG